MTPRSGAITSAPTGLRCGSIRMPRRSSSGSSRDKRARIRALLSRELPDDDLRGIRIDPQRNPVGALVIAPLLGVMPEGIGILSRHQVVAKDTFEPRAVSGLRGVVHDLGA